MKTFSLFISLALTAPMVGMESINTHTSIRQDIQLFDLAITFTQPKRTSSQFEIYAHCPTQENPIGYIYYNNIGLSAWEMLELWTNTEFRKKHIGTELVRCFLNHAKSLGATQISWQAMPTDSSEGAPTLDAIIRFYEKTFKRLEPASYTSMTSNITYWPAMVPMTITLK